MGAATHSRYRGQEGAVTAATGKERPRSEERHKALCRYGFAGSAEAGGGTKAGAARPRVLEQTQEVVLGGGLVREETT